MIDRLNIYDENGVLVMSEGFGAAGTNVDITISGLTATNVQDALAELVAAIASINNGSNYTSGVTVDGVGSLTLAMGNISAGTNVNGMTLTELLAAAFGDTE